MATGPDLRETLEQTDKLFKERKFEESFELLTPYADGSSDDPELLWRLVRMYFRKSQKAKSTDKKVAEDMAKKGYEISKKALTLGSDISRCHQWASMMLGCYSDTQGRKEKLANSAQIREHAEKAVELDPNNMAARHLLGVWHFNVASAPAAARFLFSNVPTSTYEEALVHFEAAEQVNEDGFVRNWLFLGKTHLQLKNKMEAKKWLTKMAESDLVTEEIIEAKEEAVKLLKKL